MKEKLSSRERFMIAMQRGRDTPPENIFKMVEIAKRYGKY